MSKTVVRLASEPDRARWNGFLRERPLASPLALFEWRDVLAATYGPIQRFLIAERGSEVVGILPTYVGRSIRGHRILYSLRHGLNALDAVAAESLLEAAEIAGKSLGCERTLVTSGLQAYQTQFNAFQRRTLVLDVSVGEKAIWDGFRQKTRTTIRKGLKAELSADWSTGKIDQFWSIYADVMADKAVPIHSRRFFETMIETLAPYVRFFTVQRGAVVISGGIMLVLNGFATYLYQAAHAGHQDVAPTSFMFWAVAKRCMMEGIALLDLGESKDGGSVYKFKTNFGGTPRDLTYYGSVPEERASSLPNESGSEVIGLRERLVNLAPHTINRGILEFARRYGRIV